MTLLLGWEYVYLQNQSGNMRPVVKDKILFIHGGMLRLTAVMRIIIITLHTAMVQALQQCVHTPPETHIKDCAIWREMYGNGYKMNITAITMVPLVMEVAGVQETVLKTLVIRPITITIVPLVFYEVVTGITANHGYGPLGVVPTARRASTAAAVVVLLDLSTDLLLRF